MLGVLAVAFKVVIVAVPPMFSVECAFCVNPPVPARATSTVSVPALFKATAAPVTVTFGMENVPVRVWEAVLNVCTPVLAKKVGVAVIPPLNVMVEATDSIQAPPALIVTKPVKVFVPLALVTNFKVPLTDVPAFTVRV